MVHIKVPIWSKMSVGIDQEKIKIKFPLFVKIDYKDRYGKELYPDVLSMDGAKALQYPVQEVKGKILRIIPIKDFATA